MVRVAVPYQADTCAMAATSDRLTARMVFQSASVLIAGSERSAALLAKAVAASRSSGSGVLRFRDMTGRAALSAIAAE